MKQVIGVAVIMAVAAVVVGAMVLSSRSESGPGPAAAQAPATAEVPGPAAAGGAAPEAEIELGSLFDSRPLPADRPEGPVTGLELGAGVVRVTIPEGSPGQEWDIAPLIPELEGSGAEQRRLKAMQEGRRRALDFLADNRKRPGVVERPSGLQYEVLRDGTGPRPQKGDTVVVHYRGTLLDGTEFDNSYRRGQPLRAPVAGLIQGWCEALLLMPAGAKWRVYIPSELAYGSAGSPPRIGPNELLTFEIELIRVEPGARRPGGA